MGLFWVQKYPANFLKLRSELVYTSNGWSSRSNGLTHMFENSLIEIDYISNCYFALKKDRSNENLDVTLKNDGAMKKFNHPRYQQNVNILGKNTIVNRLKNIRIN